MDSRVVDVTRSYNPIFITISSLKPFLFNDLINEWQLWTAWKPKTPESNKSVDSLAVMASGNIAVATLTTGYITEFSPAGDLVREVKMPDVYPTNICFGGPDMRTAYITLSDTGRLGMISGPSRDCS